MGQEGGGLQQMTHLCSHCSDVTAQTTLLRSHCTDHTALIKTLFTLWTGGYTNITKPHAPTAPLHLVLVCRLGLVACAGVDVPHILRQLAGRCPGLVLEAAPSPSMLRPFAESWTDGSSAQRSHV